MAWTTQGVSQWLMEFSSERVIPNSTTSGFSNDGSMDSNIAGATGHSYTLKSSDEGKTIKVRVTFIDDRGNQESVTSEPTVAIVADDAGICGRTTSVQKRILRYADASNDCALVTDAHLESVTLMGLSALRSIPPSDFDSLKPGDLDGLTNLEHLYIRGPIPQLPEGIFDDLTGLRRLQLDRTVVAELPDGVFDNLSRLMSLEVIGNRDLNTLPGGAFDSLSNLEKLDLSGTPLTALPTGRFDSLTNLEELHITLRSTALPDGVFDNLTDLEILKISGKLTELPDGVF